VTTQGPLIWVTRAAPGADATAERLAAMGLTPIVAPLIETRPLAFVPPSPDGYDALAFTSAAAVRIFADAVSDRGKPVYTVGAATAQAAMALGWRQVTSARGDVAALAQLLRAHRVTGRLLQPVAADPAADLAVLAGSDRLSVATLPVYETRAISMTPSAVAAIAAAGVLSGVIIQSPSAARALAALSPRPAHMANAMLFALSPACAVPLATHQFREIVISPFPREEALLKVIGNKLSAPSSTAT